MSLGEDVYDAATAKKYESLLEKKWTSIVRLQKKVRGFLSEREGCNSSWRENCKLTAAVSRSWN